MSPALPDPNDGSAPTPPAEPPPVFPPPPVSDAQRVAAIRAWHDELRRLSSRAPVTPILVAINVIVFVVMVASGVDPLDPKPDVLLKWGADFGPVTFGGEWWRLLTAAFLHGGAVHLAMNMFCLLGVGKATERMIGSPGFLLAYLTSAVVGNLASVAWNPVVVSVGASGAVFGTFGMFFAASLRAGDTVPELARNTLRVNMGKLLALNLAVGFFVPNVDVAAHVGGLVWGFAAGFLLGHPLRAESLRGRRVRNLMLAALFIPVAGVGLTIAGSRVSSSKSAVAELDRLAADVDRVLLVYDDAVARNANGTLTDGGFLAVMDNDVLRPWNAIRQKFNELKGDSALNPAFMRDFGDYLAASGEAFSEIRKAVATNDHAAAARSRERMTEAGQIMKKLTGGR